MIYTELHKQYLSLWIPIILLTILTTSTFVYYPEIPLGKTLIIILFSIFILFSGALIWVFYYKFSIIPVSFSFDEKKLTWLLTKTNFLFPQKEQTQNWQEITQIARIDDKYHTNYYFSRKESKNTILLQQPFVAIDEDNTWKNLSFLAEKYQIPIKTTFYDNTPPPKNISILLFSTVLSVFFAIGWYSHPNISLAAKITIILQFLLTSYLYIRQYKNKQKHAK